MGFLDCNFFQKKKKFIDVNEGDLFKMYLFLY